MDEFLAAYGLYLLIALLVVIVVVFLISGRKDRAEPVATPDEVIEAAPVADPIVVEPVAPIAVAEPAVVPVAPGAVAEAEAETEREAEGAADNLMRMKGVGPKLAAQLNALGITRYAQIAAWSDSDIAAVDAQLGAFKGRPVRDQWVDQAKYLASGDLAGFETKYGKI